VDDAITAAGGALPEADLDAVNLAAPVIDGSRIYVPRVGEVVPAVVAGGGGAGSGPGGSAAGPVDLNTATAEQLDALPGIGPATARAIVTHRQANGPFRSVEDLLDVKGIGPAKLEQFRSLVTV
jgi:competence protein ComEA